MKKFKLLLGDRVIVQPAEVAEKTETGIYIPDTAKEKPTQGIVIQVGQGVQARDTGIMITPSVKAGDVVLYSKYAGTEFPIDGENLLIMRESDIWGVL